MLRYTNKHTYIYALNVTRKKTLLRDAQKHIFMFSEANTKVVTLRDIKKEKLALQLNKTFVTLHYNAH